MNEKVALVRAYNQALSDNLTDLTALRAGLAPYLKEDTVCMEPASAPWGGTWVGLDGFMRMFTIGARVIADRFADGLPGPGQPEAFETADEYVVEGDVVIRRWVLDVPATASQPAISLPCIERYVVTGDKIDKIEVFFFDAALLASLKAAA